jgi:molybdate/tungstate transport system substrate-binding protein
LIKWAWVILTFTLSLIVLSGGLSACAPDKTRVRILCADSLILPLGELESAFEAEYPSVDILMEGHGSIQAIRTVTELHEEADVVAVADHSLIPMLMYNTKVPDTDQSYARWYIRFAANTLGIAYSPTSRYAGEINAGNWYEILARPDVRVGLADARLDSCGYRSLMALSLAESYYQNPSILKNILGEFDPPLVVRADGPSTTITVPEILRPASDRVVLRGSSIRLLALLESGDIDYYFEYRSVAEQHGLNFLELPPEINLGSADMAGRYGCVTCCMDFHRFATVQPVFTGEPIIYGVTIPINAPNPQLAQDYIGFLLGEVGQRIFTVAHQPLTPPEADHPENLPQALKKLLEARSG